MSEQKSVYQTENYISKEAKLESFLSKTGITRDMILAIEPMIVGSEDAFRVSMNDGDKFIYIPRAK